ncbi:MAG: hypothetical protein WKF84_30460 [Pyrinomonadaceae bacterium]
MQHVSALQVQLSLFEEQLCEIAPSVLARRHIFDLPVIVELTKPAAQMTKSDYDMAFSRAMLKKVGMMDATDAEVAKFMNNFRSATGGKFELLWERRAATCVPAAAWQSDARTDERVRLGNSGCGDATDTC